MSSNADSFKSNGLHLPERRQVTALAYDLVGSTQLASRLDPEDMRATIHAFHEVCTKAVKQYEGHLNSYAGDGAIAFFGYPGAHEDDAECAVRAGLDIVNACRDLNTKLGPGNSPIAVRVGIATGIVVAGGLTGEQALGRDDIFGLAPNLAHKIQAAAEANSVFISTPTYELVSGLFHLKPQPAIQLTEIAEPHRVWQVLRVRQYQTRYLAGRRPEVTPLVSRVEEIATIERRWQSAQKGEGKIVLLSGEPGIGKSRLIVAARSYLARPRHPTLLFQCSARHINTPLQPVISYLRRALRLPENIAPDVVTVRLHEIMRRLGPELGWTVPFVMLLLAPSGTRLPALSEMSAEQIKDRTLAALLAMVAALAKSRPILVVVEDAHWIDPTSQALLDQFVDQAREISALVIVTFRPGYQAPWVDQAHVTLLALNRLGDEDSALLVNHVGRGRNLPRDVVYQIIGMADGVPLFVEELTHAICQQEESGRSPGAEPKAFNIPATLSDSLTARLDQLGPRREIAQIASAIGRTFPLGLLLKVFNGAENVEQSLNLLVAFGMATITSTAQQFVFTFKHALIQESAYASMTRVTRQKLHHKIAAVLEEGYAGTEDATLEILSHHYEESGQMEKAIAALQEAARLAAAKSANVEASNLLARALVLVARMPETTACDELELALLVALGPLQITTIGPGAPAAQATYIRATELCAKLSYGPHHFTAFWGWWRTAPNFKAMHERANRISNQVAVLEDPHLRLQAHHCQWATLFMLGNQRACCNHITQGLAIYDAGVHASHGVLYGGHDPKVCGLGEKGLSLWLLGYPAQSLDAAKSCLDLAESLQHSGSMGHGRDIEIMVHRYRGDPLTVLDRADAMAAFANKSGSRDLAAKADIFRGWALAWQGEADDGIGLIHAGLEAQRQIGTQEDFPVYYEMLAEAYGLSDKPEPGLALIDDAVDMADRTGLQYWSAELFRRKGELLMQCGAGAAAEAAQCFARASAIAAAQEARSLLLRIAMSRVRHGGAASAIAELRQARLWFTEGFDTADLKQADIILREAR